MKRLEFIKKIGLATVGLPLLSSFEVFSFTKGYQQVIYPPIDDRFETFDFELFEKLKKLDKDYQKNLDRGKNKASVVLPDGTYYFILDDTKVDGTYLVCETPFYSYFSLLKSYDKRGYITEKGLYGEPVSWQKGRWYYFNKEGKLEKTINYDEVSKFTFEEVEDFCLSKGMKLRRGYKGEGALIRRIYIPGVSYNCWEITYILVGDEYGDYYRLDLQTGKVLSYRKYEYII
nr:hypothetical protein [uncultured Capnocytophaga sp.]